MFCPHRLDPQQNAAKRPVESSSLFRDMHAGEIAAMLARFPQLLSTKSPERVWLAFVDTTDSLLERSLAVHLAQALAERSCKRALLLELCSSDQAVGPRFARHPNHVRPVFRACAHNHPLLQTPHSP